MDYEKKIKNAMNDKSVPFEVQAWLEEQFSELKESVDEQSKNWILEYLYDGLRKSDEQFKDHFKTAIAWLEKQGVKPDGLNDKDEEIRQELIEMIKEDWPGRSDVIAWLEKQKEMNTNTHLPSFDEAQGTPIVKQGEKKPAEWTFEAKGWDKEQIQKCISWLQSLRPQNTWKPSDEMLEALYRVIPENVMEKSENEILLDKLYQGLKYGRVLSKK